MSTEVVTECAGGCRVSMRQSSMLRLMIKPFMSILGRLRISDMLFLHTVNTAIFKTKILEKGLHSNNKSIHIFRGFQKQITSQWWCLWQPFDSFIFAENIHAAAHHFTTQISGEYLCFPIVPQVPQDSFLLMENCHILFKFGQACELKSGWHLWNRKFSFSPTES